MILLHLTRFRQTFRVRLPEWIMACGTFGWGINSWADSVQSNIVKHTFDGPFYAILKAHMTQEHWGMYASLVGAVRIACLIINGSRPRGSTLFRAIGALLSTWFWIGLFIGALCLPWHANAVVTYGMLLIFDLFGLWYAASDAGLAFDQPRKASVSGGR